MGEMIQVRRPDGKTCPAYLVAPKTANAPGFVCIQEYWGLNDQIKKTADRFAEAGYRALVPDLYRGKVAKAADEAAHMMSNLNFPDAAEQDIRGALQHLKQRSKKKVAVGGFCMGGALTLLAALRVPASISGTRRAAKSVSAPPMQKPPTATFFFERCFRCCNAPRMSCSAASGKFRFDIMCAASSAALATLPRYKSGTSARYPASAKRSAVFLIWSLSPQYS